jgi:hypothetical protein
MTVPVLRPKPSQAWEEVIKELLLMYLLRFSDKENYILYFKMFVNVVFILLTVHFKLI